MRKAAPVAPIATAIASNGSLAGFSNEFTVVCGRGDGAEVFGRGRNAVDWSRPFCEGFVLEWCLVSVFEWLDNPPVDELC